MSLVRLNIKGISYSQTQNGAYALLLNEVDGQRKLPIVIGAFEAQSIAIALEKEIKPPRPLTHDLFKNISDRYNIVIKQVIIHKLVDGVFFSSIICERDKIEEIVDARTSDAIALAIRFNAPIFTYKDILNKAGIILNNPQKREAPEDMFSESMLFEEDTEQDALQHKNKHAHLSLQELNNALQEAVNNEDYEAAADIRDEISKRNP